MHRSATALAGTGAALFALVVGLAPAASAHEAGAYRQTNLVSDVPDMAPIVDPNLKNPWGLVHSPTSPWWIADNNAGVSTLYKGDGSIVPLVVTIPPPSGSPAGALAAPTGTVFNGTNDFVVSMNGVSAPALFLFATEDGTLSGWSPKVDQTNAILMVDNPNTVTGRVYKGLAIGRDDQRDLLFATNFRSGTVDVFDATFKPVKRPGAFTDSHIPAGYAPFGIQNIDGRLYVTYAQQNGEKHDDVAGAGHGFVDVFNTDGHLLRRLISRGELNSPWGLALAPDDFGPLSDALLVGNFGDGTIHAYDRHTGAFRGTLADPHGQPIAISGLWGLAFGNGQAAGDTHTLFFTAGINKEADGLFGTLTATEHDR